jgi:Domain of unknown function (DUF4352)
MVYKVCARRIVAFVAVSVLLTLAACSMPGGTTQSTTTAVPTGRATTPSPVVNAPTSAVATATSAKSVVATATPVPKNTAPTGPIIILTPTLVPGGGAGSQQVTLADRTLVIESVSEQTGATANSTAVSLVLAIHNTSAKPILNEATFFQLVGSQGDMFGYQSTANASFFGTIPPQSGRNGTIVFQVPTGAISGGLRLLFRSEIATETVFVRLQLS